MRKIALICFMTLTLNAFLFTLISGNTKKSITMYSYADGSGNVYIIQSDGVATLEYKPVQPEFSSSGIYSGGEYVKKKISKSQYKKILSVIHKAVENKKIHIKERIKTSGMITIQDNQNAKTYIIKPHSTEQRNIENILTEILKPAL